MVGVLGILAGFTISLAVAPFVVSWVLEWLRRDLGDESGLPGEKVPAWIVGTGERAFFTLVVAAGLSGVPVAMILWIALKMVAGFWSNSQETPDREALRFTGMLGDLASMMFALVGGGVVRMGWLMMG
jgi:hypothetical protein